MKICTFNVNSIRARKDLIVSWLEKRNNDIDVLCFQEIKVIDQDFPWDVFEGLGYHSTVFGQKTYNGVAICSKEKPKDVIRGFGDEKWDEQKRLLALRLNESWVINVYAPHGDVRGTEKFKYKQDWYGSFAEFLDRSFSRDDPLIAVGDFNVAKEDKDVYSPEALADTIGTLPEEREVFQKPLQWGLVDVFRKIYPEERTFTWWDYRTAGIWRDEGMRIDYILVTPPLVDKVDNIEVDLWPRRRRSPTPSDHAPVIASLRASDGSLDSGGTVSATPVMRIEEKD